MTLHRAPRSFPFLPYVGARLHGMGFVAPYGSKHERFEADGANAAVR
ncbi:hypothetical protein [Burkholderia sp. Ax-1724]|nr:hypothetical protein [Burkholderia sp. Ax-1724]